MSKNDERTKFVCSLPDTLTIIEMVAEAKKKGFKTDYKRVYTIRKLAGLGYLAANTPQPQPKPVLEVPDDLVKVIYKHGTLRVRAALEQIEGGAVQH